MAANYRTNSAAENCPDQGNQQETILMPILALELKSTHEFIQQDKNLLP